MIHVIYKFKFNSSCKQFVALILCIATVVERDEFRFWNVQTRLCLISHLIIEIVRFIQNNKIIKPQRELKCVTDHRNLPDQRIQAFSFRVQELSSMFIIICYAV